MVDCIGETGISAEETDFHCNLYKYFLIYLQVVYACLDFVIITGDIWMAHIQLTDSVICLLLYLPGVSTINALDSSIFLD